VYDNWDSMSMGDRVIALMKGLPSMSTTAILALAAGRAQVWIDHQRDALNVRFKSDDALIESMDLHRLAPEHNSYIVLPDAYEKVLATGSPKFYIKQSNFDAATAQLKRQEQSRFTVTLTVQVDVYADDLDGAYAEAARLAVAVGVTAPKLDVSVSMEPGEYLNDVRVETDDVKES